ncbi:hypothetical protein BJF78_34100 [Pseudonocardia sp. CNS-139]|nr:hypothetical protein BJF78_34100 [Pseudonocardia sp. CNS-139]
MFAISSRTLAWQGAPRGHQHARSHPASSARTAATRSGSASSHVRYRVTASAAPSSATGHGLPHRVGRPT